MPAPKDWTFVQLGPPNKTMTLSGYSAPFGRQRQKAVVRDAVTIRESTTYYAGASGPPTRHVFGNKLEQWELTGRFMDPAAGSGYAKTQTDYVKQFVLDAQPVEIRWGDIVGARGFIKSFDPGRESEFQVEWKMTVLVDEDIRNARRGLAHADRVAMRAGAGGHVDVAVRGQPAVIAALHRLIDLRHADRHGVFGALPAARVEIVVARQGADVDPAHVGLDGAAARAARGAGVILVAHRAVGLLALEPLGVCEPRHAGDNAGEQRPFE